MSNQFNHVSLGLMYFNADIQSSARFTRVDNSKSVDVTYNPEPIKANPKMMKLMKKLSSGDATDIDVKEFGELWQERVQRIFENIEIVVEVNEL